MDNIFNSFCSFEILNHWSVTQVIGVDSTKYLNSQITMNLFNLQDNEHILCAHCNAKGKVQSILRLFRYKNGYMYIQNNSLAKQQILELKKYSIFSNVQIRKLNNYIVLGVMGLHIKKILSSYFSKLPNQYNPLIILNEIIILWFQEPIERFLLICNDIDFLKIKNFLLKQSVVHVYNQWLLLDITIGIPIIEMNMFSKCFPQEINLDCLNALDFNKGCYCGQEMISKIHFKNINYKKLYSFIGISYHAINVFSDIEIFQDLQWKRIGYVSFVTCIKHNIFVIQGILKNYNITNTMFRIYDNEKSKFFLL